MILVSILLPLIMQSAATAKQASLVDLQVRATQAHKTYRERARSAQQCDAPTFAANEAAAKAALEASQRRRVLLTAVVSRAAAVPAAAATPGDGTEEFGRAVALLSRDLEVSASLMVKADPASAPAGVRRFQEEAPPLPQPGAPGGTAADSSANVNSVAASVLGDVATEQSLLNAYFSSSKIEIERACLEKTDSKADPFRVPAKATKRTRRVKR